MQTPNFASHTSKAVAIGILLVFFLIPSIMVSSLVDERSERRDGTVASVGESWGRAQMLQGPVLVLPYDRISTDSAGKVTTIEENAFFLPDTLDTNGELTTEIRSRGIYQVPVYTTHLAIKGSFPEPSFATLGIPPSNVKWDKAAIHIGIPDMRGVTDQVVLDWRGAQKPFVPSSGVEQLSSGIRVPLSSADFQDKSDAGYAFSLQIGLRGSTEIGFLPMGKTTTVHLSGNWQTPSFDGEFLPTSHTIDEKGFTVDWKVLDLNRSFPQSWTTNTKVALSGESELKRFDPDEGIYDEQPRTLSSGAVLTQSNAFGMRLYQPNDIYSQTSQATKYAMAIIGLVFVLVFFIEATSTPSASGVKRRVHPVQYTLIGLALIIFYSLLLSLAEYMFFDGAYAIASVATIVLITLFARRIMADNTRGYITGGVLTVLYLFIYILLQSEDYTLLIGSIGVFVILALLMSASHRIEWYGVVERREPLSRENDNG